MELKIINSPEVPWNAADDVISMSWPVDAVATFNCQVLPLAYIIIKMLGLPLESKVW